MSITSSMRLENSSAARREAWGRKRDNVSTALSGQQYRHTLHARSPEDIAIASQSSDASVTSSGTVPPGKAVCGKQACNYRKQKKVLLLMVKLRFCLNWLTGATGKKIIAYQALQFTLNQSIKFEPIRLQWPEKCRSYSAGQLCRTCRFNCRWAISLIWPAAMETRIIRRNIFRLHAILP